MKHRDFKDQALIVDRLTYFLYEFDFSIEGLSYIASGQRLSPTKYSFFYHE